MAGRSGFVARAGGNIEESLNIRKATSTVKDEFGDDLVILIVDDECMSMGAAEQVQEVEEELHDGVGNAKACDEFCFNTEHNGFTWVFANSIGSVLCGNTLGAEWFGRGGGCFHFHDVG